MFYQVNSEFRIYKYRAIADEKVYYLDDKAEFENRLLEELRMKEFNRLIQENPEVFVDPMFIQVTLPEIAYEDIVLTAEQAVRFDEIKTIKGVTLDEVHNYVLNGVEPVDNPYYMIIKLKRENEDFAIAIAQFIGGVV